MTAEERAAQVHAENPGMIDVEEFREAVAAAIRAAEAEAVRAEREAVWEALRGRRDAATGERRGALVEAMCVVEARSVPPTSRESGSAVAG